MKLDSEAVEMADVERAEVGMEGVVQKAAVDGEVDGWRVRLGRRGRARLSLGRALAWRPPFPGARRVGERGVRVGGGGVRGQVQTVCDGWLGS